MKFHKYPDFPAFGWSGRKAAAYRRKLIKERDSFPLFADQIAGEQLSVEEEKERRAQAWAESMQRARNDRAKQWRRARSALRALPEYAQKAIMQKWQKGRWIPRDPEYLLDTIFEFNAFGRLPGGEARAIRPSEIVRKGPAPCADRQAQLF